jgi:hypothetical protein
MHPGQLAEQLRPQSAADDEWSPSRKSKRRRRLDPERIVRRPDDEARFFDEERPRIQTGKRHKAKGGKKGKKRNKKQATHDFFSTSKESARTPNVGRFTELSHERRRGPGRNSHSEYQRFSGDQEEGHFDYFYSYSNQERAPHRSGYPIAREYAFLHHALYPYQVDAMIAAAHAYAFPHGNEFGGNLQKFWGLVHLLYVQDLQQNYLTRLWFQSRPQPDPRD